MQVHSGQAIALQEVFLVDGLGNRPLTYADLEGGRVTRRPKERTMPEGYCVKCKAKKEIAEAVEEVMKNGRKAIKGKCPTCGVVMFKIIGGKAVATTPAKATKSAG